MFNSDGTFSAAWMARRVRNQPPNPSLLQNIKHDTLPRRLAPNRKIGHNKPAIDRRERGATPSPTRHNPRGNKHITPIQKDTGAMQMYGQQPPKNRVSARRKSAWRGCTEGVAHGRAQRVTRATPKDVARRSSTGSGSKYSGRWGSFGEN